MGKSSLKTKRSEVNLNLNLVRLSIFIFLFATVFNPKLSFAQYGDQNKPKKSLYVGGIYPIYQSDARQLTNFNGGLTINIGFSKTFRIRKTEFIFGLEYLNRQFSFDSYYFSPNQVPLFDKSFGYTHSITSNEIQFPILYHLASTNKNRASSTISYLDLGMVLHLYAPSSTSIVMKAAGVEVYSGPTILTAQYPLVVNPMNLLMRCAAGLFFKNSYNGDGLFLELAYTYDPSPMIYTGNQNSNNLSITSTLLTLNAGYKF